MRTREQYVDLLLKAQDTIKSEFGVSSMCLFGSTARGSHDENSDVDIYVEMPPKAFKVISLKLYLQDLLGTAVDVIRRHSHQDTYLINQIEKDGITIFS